MFGIGASTRRYLCKGTEMAYGINENQLTVICTTRVERVLISIWCQKDVGGFKELVTFSSRVIYQ